MASSMNGRNVSEIFQGLESIVDIIGGTRTTAKIICEAFPNLKCIVFDRPQVVENLSGSNNLTFVGGDMFKSIPKADSILLKMVCLQGQMHRASQGL
ncbi:Isoflavone-7-O-methyltransferase 9 [Glycine soja]|uniref:Isoflavone-7-O-methyltransferase 9 n=1 Tax=Glycine soja TaxID=3848 RepID=A0A0B2PXG7_GLYSO|nr:Isoflavone-7-O-methyltransferase 9 [Glycine soja]